MKAESEFRSAIAEEALSWKDTPYHANGAVKGAGVNCAQFLYCVAKDAGVLPDDAPQPRWFTSQLAMHSKEERLVAYIKQYGAVEIAEADVKAGDIVVYKNGQAHGHAAIVIDWPTIIHVLPIHGCQMGSIDEGRLAAYSRRYFTLWNEEK